MTGAPSLLLTDLYQISMLHAYHDRGMNETAVFELFFRKLPEKRNFLMAAGLEQALDFLESAKFTSEDIDWLRREGSFDRDFLDHLAELRFTGDVDAMPEGTIFFQHEPILRVAAPMPQAQLMETRLINFLHFGTVVASKAARMVLAAPGKLLLDFGLRRAHGEEAGLLAARAAYVAGFAGTATIPAGPRFGIPVYGTMAHSFIQAHDDEAQAFLDFARTRPKGLVLLIDTYDTEAAARKVVEIAPVLEREGIKIGGVRLDSGNLLDHARNVRRTLDEGGLEETRIFVSGGLDEGEIDRLLRAGAPIDGFGVGTSLTTASDAPALDCVYKLQEFKGLPRRKKSEGKATWPGRKQVFRGYGADGAMSGDVLTIEGDDDQAGESLLRPVMRAGERIDARPTLDQLRGRAAEQLARLPNEVRCLDGHAEYPVSVSDALRELAREVDERREDVGQGSRRSAATRD